jgi:protein ImuA
MGDAALSALRNLLSPQELADGQTRVPLGHQPADACLKGGLIKGALHEVFALDSSHAGTASGFVACLALRVAEKKKLLWIRQDSAWTTSGGQAAASSIRPAWSKWVSTLIA